MSETHIAKATKPKRSVLYTIARGLAAFLMRTVMPVWYHGRERLNTMEAPFIIISNHKSWLDPVCIAFALKKKEITFLGKKELMQNKIAGAALRSMHAIAVDRNHSDMGAIRACLNALKNGEILGIFPEGTRHKKGIMEELEGGISLLALRSAVPVLPIYIRPKLRFFHRTDCFIGEPIETSDLIEQGISKETSQEFLDRITGAYAKMEEEAAAGEKKRKK